MYPQTITAFRRDCSVDMEQQLPWHAMTMRRVLSGGRNGVERAGLDAALQVGIPVGGYCLKNCFSGDSTIPDSYSLIKLPTTELCYQLEKNVVESYGTLLLTSGPLSDDARLSRDFCMMHRKPCLVVSLDDCRAMPPERTARWLREHLISVLNVSGPLESEVPSGIYRISYDYMHQMLQCMYVMRDSIPRYFLKGGV